MLFIPPKRIILSGGGLRSISHLGALQILEQKGFLKNVVEYVGVSAGSFVGFAITIGYTIKELIKFCSLFDFGIVRNLTPESAFEFPNTFGFDDGENLIKLIKSLLRQKNLAPTLTFKEWSLTKPKLQLRCFATDLNTQEPYEFSALKTPDTMIVDALRITMSLPVYFIPVRDINTGHVLVDGAILHNLPMAFLTKKENQESLAISFTYEHTKIDNIPDIMTYMSQIFACYYMPRVNIVHNYYKDRCILISNGRNPIWNFEITQEKKDSMVEDGRKATNLFFNNLKNNVKKPLRRYSVS